MKIKLKSSQRFLMPLENSSGEFLLVKEIFFCGSNSNHNVPQIHYKGTKISFNLENEDFQKEQNYVVVMNESFDMVFSEDE